MQTNNFLMKLILASFLTLTLAKPVMAFTVDNLVQFSEQDGKTIIYTLNNNGEEDLYVNTIVNELVIDDDGSIEEREYNSDNVDEWKTSLSLNKFILRSGEIKKITLTKIDSNLTSNEDEVYMVRFSPVKVASDENELSVSYGYGVLSVIETKVESEGKPIVEFNKELLTVKNDSNRFLAVKVCGSTESAYTCPTKGFLIPGRVKDFELSEEELKHENLRVVVSSNDGSIQYENIF